MTRVFHIANPYVAGKAGLSAAHLVPVIFEEDMTFTGNPGRISKEWLCDPRLLYTDQEEAIMAHLMTV